MATYSDKYKLGNFKVLTLNSDNNFSIDLSSEFISTTYMSYNIFTFPTINTAELPDNLLGFRLEENRSALDNYSCNLYTTSLQESVLYPSSDGFFMYPSGYPSVENALIMSIDEEGNLYHTSAFIVEDVKNTLRFSNTDTPKEIVYVEISFRYDAHGARGEAQLYFNTKEGIIQEHYVRPIKDGVNLTFSVDLSDREGYFYISYSSRFSEEVNWLKLTYSDKTSLTISGGEFDTTNDRCSYVPGGYILTLNKYQRMNDTWRDRKTKSDLGYINGWEHPHEIPMIPTNYSSFDVFTSGTFSCIFSFIHETVDEWSEGVYNMCAYYLDLMSEDPKFLWQNYNVGDYIIDNFTIDYSRTSEFPFMPLYIPVWHKYDSRWNFYTTNYFSFLMSESIETLNKSCIINVAILEVL